MSFPKPEAGLVIRYAYLWHSEFTSGQEEGLKDRPCAVVLVVRDRNGSDIARVLPITHATPTDPTMALEIPSIIKRHLGLDDEKAWIVISEANDFAWPGPDLRPRVRGQPSTVAYGVLPPGFYAKLRDKVVKVALARRLRVVRRTD